MRSIPIVSLLMMFSVTSAQAPNGKVRLEYEKTTFDFHTQKPAIASLGGDAGSGNFTPPVLAEEGFTVKIYTTTIETVESHKILDIDGVLTVTTRQHDPADRNRQNYPAFPMPDGSVPVLEATIMLHSEVHPDWHEMTIGIPLAILKNPYGYHEVIISFTGTRFSLYVDGQLLDNDFPFGYPEWKPVSTWKTDRNCVNEAVLYAPAIVPEKSESAAASEQDIQYWTPEGHNSWVGDVVTIYFRGRYHLFYLFDRRHHQSKFGKGAHYFEHLSTTDFRNWTIHDAATPLGEQWECIGTGTPFVFRDKLYLSYGLHTGRIYPEEQTAWPAQWKYLEQHGCTGAFRSDTTKGYPAGALYAVSADGISDFRKQGIMFHPCQNPSVYTDHEGRLMLLANAGSSGTWTADSIDGGWRCINKDFPPGGDCTFFFSHGGFDYIAGGFTGFWAKPSGSPGSAYKDMVAAGLDFYDGSNVPSITEIPGGRMIMAGWIPVRGWGGPLVIRELIQYPDGRLGSKWMDEITPGTGEPETRAALISGSQKIPSKGKSFLLTFTIKPGMNARGRASITFLPATDEKNDCELSIFPGLKRAQFGQGSIVKAAPVAKTLREGGSPQEAGNYAIENLTGTGTEFQVRVIVKETAKLGGSLIDVEIAGQRTMISFRPDLSVNELLFRSEAAGIKDVKIAALEQ